MCIIEPRLYYRLDLSLDLEVDLIELSVLFEAVQLAGVWAYNLIMLLL